MIVYSIITQEDKWYVATAVPTGVVSQGKTIAEAKANLQEALELYYEDEPIQEKAEQPLIAPVEIQVKTRA
jgi:predicted RNase H-like HicB family nuclease